MIIIAGVVIIAGVAGFFIWKKQKEKKKLQSPDNFEEQKDKKQSDAEKIELPISDEELENLLNKHLTKKELLKLRRWILNIRKWHKTSGKWGKAVSTEFNLVLSGLYEMKKSTPSTLHSDVKELNSEIEMLASGY